MEVCKVKAKELDPASIKKRKRPMINRASVGSMQSIDVDEDEEKEVGEFDYESGEEGKAEGRWEKKGKV